MQREHDEFLDGWLTGDALTALKTVRARVNSGVVISPELGKAILRAMDILAGDLITAVSDRERYNAEAHQVKQPKHTGAIISTALKNKEHQPCQK